MYPPAFRYHRPQSLQDAIAHLQQDPEAKLLAGGHSLLPALKLRLASPKALIDVAGLAELKGIRQEGDQWVIGALTTHRELEHSNVPLLAEVAAVIGDPPVRNRGTIGGALAHADPAADYPAAVLALGASLRAAGPNGEREIAAEDFFIGMFTTALAPDEILTDVRFVAPGRHTGLAYTKFSHPASGYAVVGVAAKVVREGEVAKEVCLGLTGASYQAFRAKAVEGALSGKALDEAALDRALASAFEAGDMSEDHFASAEYRAELCRVMARRALMQAWARAA